MITAKELEIKTEEFLKRDIKVIDDYIDEHLKGFRTNNKFGIALLGLCQLCYAQGYVDCEKDED